MQLNITTNLATRKAVRIKSAQRLRSAVRDHAKETAEILGRGREAAEAKTVTKAEAVDTAMKAANAVKTPKDAATAKDAKGGKSPEATRLGGKAHKAAKGGEGKKGMSGLDAAAKVLAEAGKPTNCKEMVDTMLAKGYWKTDGKTPSATIYAAIIREIAKKGKDARFRKADRGLFELTAAAHQ